MEPINFLPSDYVYWYHDLFPTSPIPMKIPQEENMIKEGDIVEFQHIQTYPNGGTTAHRNHGTIGVVLKSSHRHPNKSTRTVCEVKFLGTMYGMEPNEEGTHRIQPHLLRKVEME